VDPKSLRNRLVIATSLWREATEDPLPKMPAGDPAAQIEGFELQVVDLLCREATPATAREVAAKTWDLVHDRSDDDPVKRRVVECHETLAKLSNVGAPGEDGEPVEERAGGREEDGEPGGERAG
jgi:hypothetical protein